MPLSKIPQLQLPRSSLRTSKRSRRPGSRCPSKQTWSSGKATHPRSFCRPCTCLLDWIYCALHFHRRSSGQRQIMPAATASANTRRPTATTSQRFILLHQPVRNQSGRFVSNLSIQFPGWCQSGTVIRNIFWQTFFSTAWYRPETGQNCME